MLRLIRLYKFFSRFWPARCRFYPSCSSYAEQAIIKYGLVRGGWLIGKRLSKCHPWNSGGVDFPKI